MRTSQDYPNTRTSSPFWRIGIVTRRVQLSHQALERQIVLPNPRVHQAGSRNTGSFGDNPEIVVRCTHSRRGFAIMWTRSDLEGRGE